MPRPEPEILEVDPARLAWGKWNEEKGREIGTGDIHAAYSCDVIGMGQPIKRPFKFNGALWVTVSMSGRGGVEEAEAYRLTPLQMFSGSPTTYRQKLDIDGGETARNDPSGFYDRMTVKHGKESFVLCGPPVKFVASALPVRPDAIPESNPAQLSLF